jgi:hypothetical protein
MLLVHLNWNAASIVPYGDSACVLVDVHSDFVHGFIALKVVSGVHQYFVWSYEISQFL